MRASGVHPGPYPQAADRRTARITRAVGALGLEPLFLGALAVAVAAGAAAGVGVSSFGTPSRAAVAEPTGELVESGPPPWETTWLMPIRLHHGRPVGGIQRLEVDEGDEVAIGVDLDTSATISIEGYGLWTYVHPYQKGLLELTAWDWGRFRVRADDRVIGILTVRPQWAGSAAQQASSGTRGL